MVFLLILFLYFSQLDKNLMYFIPFNRHSPVSYCKHDIPNFMRILQNTKTKVHNNMTLTYRTLLKNVQPDDTKNYEILQEN